MTKRTKDRMKPSVFGMGCFGNGDYKSRDPKTRGKTPAYSRWQRMLERCYSDDYLAKKPSYIGCSVCDEWLNFQTFAAWFYNSYPDDGRYYVLDKDVKVKGNKVYSPITCLFVSSSDNSLERNGTLGIVWRMLSPEGDEYEFSNQAAFAKDHGLYKGQISRVMRGLQSHHKGWTSIGYELA